MSKKPEVAGVTESNEPKTKTGKAVTYTVDEFAKAAGKVFGEGTSPDIVFAAFKVKGIDSATVEDAKKLVNAFANKEVE